MNMAEVKKLIPAEEYNDAVGSAHLLDVKMIASDFDIRATYFSFEKGDLKFSYGCESGVQHYSADDGKLVGTFHVEAIAKKSRKVLLKSKATYVVAFVVEGRPTEVGALAYLRRVGAFACWPYFRSHFATLCGAAGADAPTLPVMTGNLPAEIKAG
ncbi:hypothetical protein ABC365_15340 [Brevundimonas sp. 3P9-tot-E]|uniref:hypothetical protein n=1 Tax=Brevundimonas TaxID=41275 RepID=UPI0034D66D0E